MILINTVYGEDAAECIREQRPVCWL